ncbi:ABC transporter permease [Companilactobacillus alimentarius]|uniref:Peptide ABC transporter permease n=1 Tax=Companilactobacillus alimentarius DSM 20249 TaxID=1423720 RepID=A0A2K9HMN4_9LACO|nr:FtsX-like permease family protein [Companilactobacillus alimentarius]AUI72465.1 peptide ABC transporter permease [Companilactobacillus alimentarius DSM 20249]KRK77766.1 antimicrobial peptide ABC transporter permease [Companilactobacillus alimentarius DSM 20249]MDT6953056.1 FtsX-like permease family protein [Companilactobacillus alimentarius]GEO44995.1 peptide ABC transporter permease [Companilactobacillus alimentarius]
MKPLTKNMLRSINQAKGRFIAIILIIMLGVLIFVGVKATGPSLNNSLNKTVADKNLSDVQVVSTTGFDKKDIKLAEKVKGAKAETTKFKYVMGGKSKVAIALYGYDKDSKQNQLIVRNGRLPKNSHEIVLDKNARNKYDYKLGDTFKFSKSADLKRQSYKIVGFVDSPQYIDNQSRGVTNIADGQVSLFAYIPKKQMNLATDTMLNVRFNSLKSKNTFSKDYKNAVNAKVKKLKKEFKGRAKQRTNEVASTYLSTLNQQQKQLDQLKAVNPTAVAIQQQKLDTAKEKILKQAKTTYTWQTRQDLTGFSAYGESSDRIAAIANVFPVFFFLIAALITFTTITRMVEEARGEIGTFKAFGYTKWEIAKNYFYYALSAGLIGAVLGAVIGTETLPRIVLSMYKQYIALDWVISSTWQTLLIAVIFSLLATVGAALLVVRRELGEGPAALMRPKAPKSAKKILLERIKPLWNHLSFNSKVSYRNLFRFKSRMFMTIIGIAGGTALILTGFGIQNSITASGNQQYKDIFSYQAVVKLNENANLSKVDRILNKDKNYRSNTRINSTTAKLNYDKKQVNDVNVYTPTSAKDFKKYVHLTTNLDKNKVALTKKTAQLLNVKTGDKVKVTLTSGKKVNLKVGAITENYVGHYLYLSPKTYRQKFGKLKTNTLLLSLKNQTSAQRKHLANKLLDSKQVMGTSYTYDVSDTVSKMSTLLRPIILILILLSGILSFVVLYNLTNINVSERIRELSTIKVLGFYNNEVTMYVVRENIILTIVGIILGYGVGNLLTAYILNQAATEQVIFPLTIHWIGYVVATLLMIIFTAIVMLVTHRKLKHIDMIGALKSNE